MFMMVNTLCFKSLFLMFAVQFTYKTPWGVYADWTLREVNLMVYVLSLMIIKLLHAW